MQLFSALATVVGIVASMCAALLHIRDIGTIDDEIDFLNSWHSTVLHSAEDYNTRYGKYGVHIDASELPATEPERTLAGPSIANRKTLIRLWKLKARKVKLASFLVVVAAISAVCAVLLLSVGL